jgi:hypothetical protein
MQLTRHCVWSRLVMPIPLAIILWLFKACKCLLECLNTAINTLAYLFWIHVSAYIQEMLGNSLMKDQVNEVRVPTLIFDYPRHSGATDEGMTPLVLDIGLPGFWPRGESSEGTIKAHKHGRLARPWSKTWHVLQGLEEQDLVRLGLV